MHLKHILARRGVDAKVLMRAIKIRETWMIVKVTTLAAEASNGSEQSRLTGSSYSAGIADKCFRTLNLEGPKLRYHV